MTALRDYLRKRGLEIRGEMSPLVKARQKQKEELSGTEAKIEALKNELLDIERAERALDQTTDKKQPPTIKEAVLRVLQDEGRPMTAQEILAQINSRFFDGAVPRTSLSPQLSRLNNDDRKIKLEGSLWSLRSENDEGPAKAEPSFLD